MNTHISISIGLITFWCLLAFASAVFSGYYLGNGNPRWIVHLVFSIGAFIIMVSNVINAFYVK